jgi:uncharacterized protein YcfJ
MLGMTRSLLGAAALAVATHAAAQITFYEGEGFRGRAFTTERPVWNLERFGFNDRASSVIVDRGRWEVCEDARFEGRCVVLRHGSYDSLAGLGLNHRISSVRPLGQQATGYSEAPAPLAAPTYEYRRRPNERLFEVPVSEARAVVGPPEQRCWVERHDVVQQSPDVNVPGAIAGAVIGGILGHQIGAGRGRDVATGIGAVGGAAIGANVGRGGSQVYSQDVQRCANVPGSARPSYWDVTYSFRGQWHHVQMSTPPGATLWVNANGEPRG